MRTEQEIREMLSKSRAVLRMRVNLFENQVTDMRLVTSMDMKRHLSGFLQ